MDNPINIAVIAPYQIYPAKMGGQKCIASFYDYLSQSVLVTVISTDRNESPSSEKIKLVKALGSSFLRYLNPLLILKTRKILNQGKFTHLIIEHPYFGWLGYLQKKLTDVKLVIHSHNIEAMRFKSTGKWWWRILWHYERFVHQVADCNFFITDEDRQWAETHYSLNPLRCFTITYGTTLLEAPGGEQRKSAQEYLQSTYNIPSGETILLFNGTLNYKPNLDALMIILEEINPVLTSRTSFKYKLIICGKDLPGTLNKLQDYSSKNVIYAGFVKDINPYFEGAHIFLNPVIEGGGIKTKLVEALACNLSCISTVSGATGVSEKCTGRKLAIVNDGDWAAFTETIFSADKDSQIPAGFFDEFYWGNIAAKALNILKNIA